MGDMKTPDFDDLLAAFDIPDMVDPKAAIESGHHDDHDGQHKPTNGGVTMPEEEDQNSSTGPDIGVSVIVKNIRNTDTGEHGAALAEKEGRPLSHPHPAAMGNGLHNGFLTAMSPSNCYAKNGGKIPKVEGLPVNDPASVFNQFSPISSAEEFEDDDKIEVDDPNDKPSSHQLLRSTPNPLTGHPSCTKREEQTPKATVSTDSVSKPRANGNANQSKPDENNNNNNNNSTLSSTKLYDSTKVRKPEEQTKDTVPQAPGQESMGPGEPSGHGSASLSQAKAKSSAKLSSCIAAIAALSAKKASSVDSAVSASPSALKESITTTPQNKSPTEDKDSPRVTEKQTEQESALEVAKRLLSKEPDSPLSVTSESSSKGSPSSPTGTTPVIPKVRIKTIKTSSGQIKRTVTRVLPEFDPDGLKEVKNVSIPTSIMVSSMLSSPTCNVVFSTPTQPSLPTTVVATSGGPSMEITKQVTIKPVATAFLPVSAVKTAGSQVINLKLANNTTVKATVIPAASVQSASSAILKAASAIQQQTVMVPASSLANAKLVPKTVHLTNLNLLPQTVSSAACEIHQALSSTKQAPHQQLQQGKQHALLPGQAPKRVSRVQVLANSQSSVVEAFNKVLSCINPVPVYVPNLSPPTSACIMLPSRGYKCLECGDSFALEKSLSQHYERRSVRIEVTCNHCAKNLVFYNKCSLLSHARGHKDEGMVMQCSHLILKPIPTDQMITTSPPPAPPSFSPPTSTSQSLGSAPVPSPGRSVSAGVQTPAVISAPSSAPLVAALPLEDDASRLCRHSLKCLECNEIFQDDSSLAMHYQQAPESSGQKTCTICQMLLPNQCSFASHQRIHQHKSPYICPECGATCRSVYFQSHVTKNCLHYTRRVGYRCVHCSVIFADVATLKCHIQSTHCEVFYKCPICPMAFKSAPGMHSHGYTQHPGAKVGEPKLIYKCSMCDTVFTLQSLLSSHFDQHILNHKVSVFKCPDCSMHYAQKQLMVDHIKAMHGTLKTIEGPPNLGINLPLSAKPTNPNSTSSSPSLHSTTRDGANSNSQEPVDKKPPLSPLKKANSNGASEPRKPPTSGYTCGDCVHIFSSREAFVSHMRREHGKILKKHPCRLCDKSFSSSHSLCRHNRLKHKGMRKLYNCLHCPATSQPFTKRVLLDQHIQLIHGIKDSETKTGSSDNRDGTQDKEHSQSLSPKRKQEEDEGSPALRSRGSDSQPLKKLKVNVVKVHRCAVCGFTSEDVAAFLAHIPQHKCNGSSFQCRECGLCYTSHRSLSRHLFIVHRLKEPQGPGRRGARGGEEDDQSQRENQRDEADENDDGTPSTRCKVCGKVFETEGNLNTHMRTHGMAFIKARRLSTAEK